MIQIHLMMKKGDEAMKKYMINLIIMLVCCAIMFLGFNIGKILTNLIQTTKEVKVIDTEAIHKLQEQYNQLQLEYDKLLTEHTTFSRHLEVYERGAYDGYTRARVIEVEE